MALRVALRYAESGNFNRWQGALIPSLLLVAFALYVSVDLNVKILYAGNVTDGVTESVFRTLQRALAAVPKFLNVHGLGVVVYVTLVAPAIGAEARLFLSEELKSPNLRTTPPYYAVAIVLFVAFAAFGAAHVFCLHGVLLDDFPIREARRRSAALVRENWRYFWGQNISFGLSALALTVLAGVAFFMFPLSLGAQILPQIYAPATARSLMILLLFLNAAFFGALSLLVTPRYFIRLTKLYRECRTGATVVIPERGAEKHPLSAALALFYVLEIAALASQTAYNVDELFPPLSHTRIVAHRSGGNENAENTRSGLETAIALGAYGSEIDIQRTADGHYVVNHDATFERVAGDERSVKDMTLEEIQQLRHPVPTLEEMLDASKGRIILFIELKGSTADRRMCNDVVKLIRERDMERQTVLLSFGYNLLDYVENRWPEIQTGYLTFLTDEDPAALRCDYVAVAENSATDSVMKSVRAAGKKALVWTPNGAEAQERFFVANADALITDNVVQATEILKHLNARDGLTSVMSGFVP